jgi:hypothetical protein
MKELIERLRLIDGVCNEAADALEQQAPGSSRKPQIVGSPSIL